MIYFDNASTSHPKAPGVSDAVKSILDRGCFNINRGGYAGAYEVSNLVFETRGKLADFFGADSGRNVVFSGGITHSLNVALKGILRPGDRVVTTPMEHNSVIRPLFQLEKQGVEVVMVRCGADGMPDMDDFASKITKATRLVTVSHASNVCGTIAPVAAIGNLCRERGALLLVDSAQTAGVIPISMRGDSIDILAFTAHKGLLSMQGLGGLVLSQQIADDMIPLLAGGTGSFTHIAEMPMELPDRLEAGTLNLPGIAAVSAALDYINKLGISEIYKREMRLISRLQNEAAKLEGVRIMGPENLSDKTAIAALDFRGMDNAQVSARLDNDFGIMTRCGLHCAPNAHKTLGTFPNGLLRCSLGHMNTDAQVDEFIMAIKSIIG